jgi:hypothetical protein
MSLLAATLSGKRRTDLARQSPRWKRSVITSACGKLAGGQRRAGQIMAVEWREILGRPGLPDLGAVDLMGEEGQREGDVVFSPVLRRHPTRRPSSRSRASCLWTQSEEGRRTRPFRAPLRMPR